MFWGEGVEMGGGGVLGVLTCFLCALAVDCNPAAVSKIRMLTKFPKSERIVKDGILCETTELGN